MATFNQQSLTERLLLIRGLGVRRIPPPSLYYDDNTKLDLRMLNLIAACLTTGRSEGVAAAFDKSNGISLILSKVEPILPTDLSATTEFLTTLTTTEHWYHLLPFLVRHTKDNMDNRVRRLHESIVEVFDDLLSAAAGYSLDRSLEREFPYSDSFRLKYPDEQPPSLPAMLVDLIRSCRNITLPFDLSPRAFLELYIIADTFRRSRFMRGLTNRQPLELPLKNKIERLQRRLGDICQYDGLELLIKRVRQVGSIPFRWVGDEFARSGAVEISPTALCAVERQTGLHLNAQDMITLNHFVDSSLPSLADGWDARRVDLHPQVHPELRIILHLSPSLIKSSPSSWTHDSDVTIPIGSNRPSCVCCRQWIYEFNCVNGLKWGPNNTYPGKLRVDWAYPAPVDFVSITRANAAVKDKIAYKLVDSPLGYFAERD
ncbi:hypothetical protein DXG03_005210 [Asterophora parasitica]|uniref:Uncharacterized protein n=1 Tax=Asterophora parasitica TaxID=117018 RepID=A0A9P7G279_9AGAR|nr:hypothetical protein DXG03_005210 [Asterophora parasitica]